MEHTSAEDGSAEARFVRWLPISHPRASVVEDVRRFRKHPLVSPEIEIYGMMFDIKTGHLIEIEKATQVGRARRSG